MIATILPYDSGVNKGFMIHLADDEGKIVEKIAVSGVVIEGDPWACMELVTENSVRLVR